MNSSNKTQIVKNLQEKSVLVSREFSAPLEKVWRACSEKEILDQWWGPSPWRAETKQMDFKAGGHWLYAMIGLAGEKHWARMNYINIKQQQYFEMEDVFCDENGVVNSAMPVSKGKMTFTKTDKGTRIEMFSVYPTESDLKQIVEMGFEEGISICFDQLEKIFSSQKI